MANRLLLLVTAAVLLAVQFAYVFRAALVPPDGATHVPLACLNSGKGGKPPGSSRDCGGGLGAECTQAQPCTPCSAGGCIPCARAVLAGAVTGECFFVDGVGPYCADLVTGVVGPCTTCCS